MVLTVYDPSPAYMYTGKDGMVNWRMLFQIRLCHQVKRRFRDTQLATHATGRSAGRDIRRNGNGLEVSVALDLFSQ